MPRKVCLMKVGGSRSRRAETNLGLDIDSG
jgi:hypothetical protein